MKIDEGLFEMVEALSSLGWPEVEVLHKKGRSRTVQVTTFGELSSLRQEEGWAVRVGDKRRSFFYAASGEPRPDSRWPEADGGGLRLPSARPAPAWQPPSTLDSPLVGEGEARGFFEGLDRALDNELPGARLLVGHLDDGSSESYLASSRQVTAAVRHRSASLHLEAVGPVAGSSCLSLDVADRNARELNPIALARRLADLLLVSEKGTARPRDRGEFLLAPSVVTGLLAALQGLWIGPAAEERAAAITDTPHIGSSAFTLIDNGRFPGGVSESPLDGEGQPTRAVTLVEEGTFRQPVLAWWQAGSDPSRASGCSSRPSWRDRPRPGPTHLYVTPDPSVRVAHLIESLSRGYYLIGLSGPPRIESDFTRFAAPVTGFALSGGKPTAAVAGAWLVGSISAFLGGIVAKARDLTFTTVDGGMMGSPSLLVKGLELRQQL